MNNVITNFRTTWVENLGAWVLNITFLYYIRPLLLITIITRFIISDLDLVPFSVDRNTLLLAATTYSTISILITGHFFYTRSKNQKRSLAILWFELFIDVFFISIFIRLNGYVETDLFLLYTFPLIAASYHLKSLNQIVIFFMILSILYFMTVFSFPPPRSSEGAYLVNTFIRAFVFRWFYIIFLLIFASVRSYMLHKLSLSHERFSVSFGKIASVVTDLDQLNAITDEYKDIFDAYSVHLRLEQHSGEGKYLQLVAISGKYSEQIADRFNLNSDDVPLFVRRYLEIKPHIVQDARQDAYFMKLLGESKTNRKLHYELEQIRTFICIPLIAGNNKIGLITIAFDKRHHLTAQLTEFIQTYSNYIALFIANLKANTKYFLFSSLYDQNISVFRHISLTERLEAIANGLNSILGSETSIIYLIDRRNQQMKIAAINGKGQYADLDSNYSQGKDVGIVGQAIQKKITIISDDYPNASFAIPKFVSWTQTVIATPLFHPQDGSIIGVIKAINKVKHFGLLELPQVCFDREFDKEVIEKFAVQASLAYSTAKTYTLEKQISNAAKEITQISDKQSLATIILENLQYVVDFDTASIIEIDGNRLIISGHYGFAKKDPSILNIFDLSDKFPNHLVLNSQNTVILNNLDESSLYKKLVNDSNDDASIRSWMGVPLISAGKVFGMITLDRRHHNWPFTDEEERYAKIFADHAAIAIHNSHLLTRTEVLRETAQKISMEANAHELGLRILQGLGQLIEFDTASVQYIRSDNLRIRLAVIDRRGNDITPQKTVDEFVKPLKQDELVREICETKRILVVSLTADDTRFDKELLPDVKSWVGMPLVIGHKVIGLITLDHSRSGYYIQSIIEETLTLFASHASFAVRNSELLRSEKQRSAMLLGANRELEAARYDLQRALEFYEEYRNLIRIGMIYGEDIHIAKSRFGLAKRTASRLADGDYDNDPAAIKRQSQRVISYINQYLDALESTKLEADIPDPLNVDVLDLIEDVLNDKRISTHIDIKLSSGKANTTVFGAIKQIKQVFYVIIDNAINAMSDGEGTLSIVLSDAIYKERASMLVLISDTGRGIRPIELSFLFAFDKPFTKDSGSGMGLIWARSFLRYFGGDLKVRSLSEKGTEVTVYIPRDFSKN